MNLGTLNFFLEGEFLDLPGERRRTYFINLEGAVPISGDSSGLHVLPDGLLDMLVKPLLQLSSSSNF